MKNRPVQTVNESKLAVTQTDPAETNPREIPSFIYMMRSGDVFHLFGNCCQFSNNRPMIRHRCCMMCRAQNNVPGEWRDELLRQQRRNAAVAGEKKEVPPPPARPVCPLLPMLIQDQVDAEAPGLRVLPGSLCQRFKKLTEEKPVEAQRTTALGATMRMDKKTEWITALAVAHLYANNPFAFIKVAVVAALPAFPRGMAVM